MSVYDRVKDDLAANPRTWTVTGAAGFIGSSLVETLLSLGQTVVGLDNFATGFPRNLDDVRAIVGEEAWGRFTFVEGDIRDVDACAQACRGADYLLHQAALGSVPRSIADPSQSTSVNVGGFVNILFAAHEAGASRCVYASSSSVYGDHPGLPKVEEATGAALSPYAATKVANELFAGVFGRVYGMEIIGLRYFNVFGPRQDPDGAYAAVIPRWVGTLRGGEACTIFGDGSTSRDFSYIANVVQGNILAATTENEAAVGSVFNVAAGGRTTLEDLFSMIYEGVSAIAGDRLDLAGKAEPGHQNFRAGDIQHSHADISRAQELLGFESTHTVEEGLAQTLRWYLRDLGAAS